MVSNCGSILRTHPCYGGSCIHYCHFRCPGYTIHYTATLSGKLYCYHTALVQSCKALMLPWMSLVYIHGNVTEEALHLLHDIITEVLGSLPTPWRQAQWRHVLQGIPKQHKIYYQVIQNHNTVCFLATQYCYSVTLFCNPLF